MDKITITIFAAIGILIVAATLSALPIYFLWNWLMPEIFGLKTITIWQAWGLGVLCNFIFKPYGMSTSKD